MTLTQKTNHVEEGLSYLLSQFKDSTNLKNMLTCYLNQIQDLEDMWFELLLGRRFSNAIGAQLDGYGSIVGVRRENRSDAEYKLAITAQKLLNICNGTIDELINLLKAFIGTYSTTDTKGAVTLDRLYLEAGTFIPAGKIVSVENGGEQWETLAIINNTAGYRQIMSVAARAMTAGYMPTLAGAINYIVTPVAGWNAISVVQSNSGTFALTNGQTLTLEINGGILQTFTFLNADFVDITHATVSEVVTKIHASLIDGDVIEVNNKVWIENAAYNGSIQIIGGTANIALGFPITLIKGMNSVNAVPGYDALNILNIEYFPAAFTIELVNSIYEFGINPEKVAHALWRGKGGGIGMSFLYRGDEPVFRFDESHGAEGFGASAWGSGSFGSGREIGCFDRCKLGGAL